MELVIERELFQWEKNRKVFIKGENSSDINCIRFFNKKSSTSLEVAVIDESAKIPNSLLTEDLPIIALACMGTSDKAKVILRKEFKVLYCPRPENYEGNVDDDSDYPDINIDEEIIFDGGVEK